MYACSICDPLYLVPGSTEAVARLWQFDYASLALAVSSHCLGTFCANHCMLDKGHPHSMHSVGLAQAAFVG